MPEEKRKLYQLCDRDESAPHAGGKAFKDMAAVAESMGFERLKIRMDNEKLSPAGFIKRHIVFAKDYLKACRQIEAGSVLLMQHPLYAPLPLRYPLFAGLKRKGVKFISHVIDVEELRGLAVNRFIKREFLQMLKLADVIIVHNERMLEWFVLKGVERAKLVNVEIFDNMHESVDRPRVFEKSIAVAGNLSLVKSGYLKYLGTAGDCPVHLYGPLENEEETLKYFKEAVYHGVYPAEELPGVLEGGFGLVWDGDSPEGGSGPFGEYLKYNDPHKLGLYLSAGMPVMVWSGSAAADYVKKHRLGLCIDDLREIPKILDEMSAAEWTEYSVNAQREGEDIRSGAHFKRALKEAEERL